ncbi:protein of unknown function UPF0153 [Desulfovibrio sp. X2]|uniref:YkgJ family cysteine cluster protein n=1 Tax=Desulfovibrio sp. X2 TaxID=941449 RepID=UPI000358BEC8|nr:YkgJ family cysteine cluster protein [Desulfovibrio sp. X2]EPR39984.1 protein of unknown function UPF0153 [Desulfovibrio sp. X2]
MTKKSCTRCGTCCENGGPALHGEDACLMGTVLSFSDLVTLRAGEPAHDQIADEIRPLEREIVKLAGRDPLTGRWACRFHTGEGCAIYADRPMECRLLDCRDTAALVAAYDVDRLTRLDLLPDKSPPVLLIVQHEESCPAGRALELAKSDDPEDARTLKEMIAYDHALRDTLAEKGLGRSELLFLLGRPLDVVLKPVLEEKKEKK